VVDQTVLLYRGEDASLAFSPPQATAITGWSLAFSVAVPGGTPVLTLTTAGGDITVVSATAGTFTVGVSRAHTGALPRPTYQWDLWRVNAGSYERLAGGQLLVRPPVYPPP
jgi:hypothetical protein